MAEKVEQELRFEKLVSGDRPSVLALGIFGAEALKKTQMAVFLVDVLGRVHLAPPEAVKVLMPPRISEDILDSLEEDKALEVLIAQGDTEEQILDYIRGRKGRGVHGQ